MFYAGIVLITIAAGGVGLAFAAIGLARDAEAVGGVGEREGDEQRQRRDRGKEGSPEWGGDESEHVRHEKYVGLELFPAGVRREVAVLAERTYAGVVRRVRILGIE